MVFRGSKWFLLLAFLIFITILWGSDYYYLQFTYEEMDTQGD